MTIETPHLQQLRGGRKTPPLSVEEERSLDLSKTSDRDKLFYHNIGFALTVSYGLWQSNQSLDLDELDTIAGWGLFEATKRFKAEMGVRFISYAVFWIRRRLYEEIALLKNMPQRSTASNDQMQITKDVDDLTQQLGRYPTIFEIEDRIGAKKAADNHQFTAIKSPASTDSPLDSQSRSQSNRLIDLLAARSESPSDAMEFRDAQKILIDLIDQGDPRHGRILKMYFGLSGYEPRTFAQVGLSIGLTRERVRQIVSAAMTQLKRRIIEHSDRHGVNLYEQLMEMLGGR